MVYQIIYTSAAAWNVTDADLCEIAKSASRYNTAIDVTGMLLSYDGNILQVLEGEESALKALHRKIQTDPRHVQHITLISRHIEKREFPNWSMGYKAVNQNTADDFLFKLTGQSLYSYLPETPSIELGALTNAFARVSRI